MRSLSDSDTTEQLLAEPMRCRDQLPIDVLPDDVLLEIFAFYVGEAQEIEAWQSLVHVCQRW